MYPTIYLIILLSVQETPKVLANQISVRMCLGQLRGGNAFTQLPFLGFLSGMTYGYLLSSKSMILTLKPGTRNTETGAQLSHSLSCRGSLGLSEGIRYVLYTEETSPGLVLHRCLCPGTYICAWKIPTPHFSIMEPSAQRDRFFSNKKVLSLQVPYYIFYKHIHPPTHTLQLKALQC